jgi:hypothetical protein
MNDETHEQKLRELPAPELPAAWREEILSQARRAAHASSQKSQVWPSVLVYLRHLCLRNPITAGAMAALWMLIFILKAGTPVDPDEKLLLANFDPNRPVHLVSISDEILLAQLLQEEPEQRHLRQIP